MTKKWYVDLKAETVDCDEENIVLKPWNSPKCFEDIGKSSKKILDCRFFIKAENEEDALDNVKGEIQYHMDVLDVVTTAIYDVKIYETDNEEEDILVYSNPIR